ncbi:MarR family winged helix-turn-helix transcriptional regulator [Oerskovia enterophila]|uniref:MarR family protein n=1 Tax=Oerskovia enterophila TaxID=43678 RepID=A0A163S282_9CELL|nr:MarR family transcriptional regulator [Oerskovia enterophila]KZM35936.1 MarR family protein [Oerskovia enterophila]OCI31365.1 MarR family protein [Oerskovia enterophila]
MSEPGWRVVLLLAGAFRGSIDALHSELAEQGHPEARPLHGFALQAIGPDGCTINELGQRLGVSKQAAAKTAVGLEKVGYVVRDSVPGDRRAVLLRRTSRAEEFLAASAAGFERVMDGWRRTLGDARFDALVEALADVADERPVGDLPGWLSQRSSTPDERPRA